MLKCFLHLCLFALVVKPVISQELYIPYNLVTAYESGSRDYDGSPGPDYFQNKSSYKIKAEFHPDSKTLRGKEWITYYNNSNEVLSRMVFRLYQDYYKKGGIRDKSINPDDVHDGTRISYLSVNDTVYNVSDPLTVIRSGTNMIVMLEEYLLPKTALKIVIEWEFDFPVRTTERFGTYNNSSFFVAYWYPQVAVFDDIDGWDFIDYNGTQEFYNDFNDYDCEIIVPSDYLVWATGNWLNPDEILQESYLQRYNLAKSSDEVVHIITGKDLNHPSRNKRKNVYRFSAANVTDFAFAVSNKYLWDARSVRCSDSDERIFIHAVYPKKAVEFHKVSDIAAKSICLLEDEIIGIPFPFKNIVAFNGSDGMEFPMMINDEDYADYNGTVNVTAHEIGHSYFPFLVGTNEKKYAWMDEGLITFLAKEIERVLSDDEFPHQNNLAIFKAYSGNEQEVPLMIPSNQLRGITYQVHAYYRSSVAFFYLRDYLGTEDFQKALKEFIGRWEGKHPTPYDFFFTFNDVTGRNLNWFWNAWFFNPGWVDLTIANVEIQNDAYHVIIENKGGLPVPVDLNLIYADGETESVKINADCWKKDNERFIYKKISTRQIRQVYIDEKNLPDKHPENNYFLIDY
ncbi:MAG TPA: M1 family metallopeptidase [Bacteroidales bacterium]|nr:M1 family metallopeptidase [Bacteroidales bacterium]